MNNINSALVKENSATKKKVNLNKIYNDICIPIIFLAPILVLFTVVMMNSVIQAVYMSFFEWVGIAGIPMEFVGLKNYNYILNNSYFWSSMKNVGVFILQGTIVQLPLSFFLAYVVSKNIKFSSAYKTIFFIPVIIPLTAVGLMWLFLLNPNGGAINELVRLLGFENFNVNFLGNTKIAIYSVALVSAWVYVGYNMVIFAAGMTSIPNDVYEAARIDGANEWQQVFYVTVPMLKETFKIYSVMMITGSLKTFDLIFAMTKGGPNRATESPAIMMYNEVFGYNHYGYGNVIATIILVLGLLFSILANKAFVEKDS